jgi:hypothetical protein
VGGLLGGQSDAKKADAHADEHADEDETTHELRALPTDAARADEIRRDAQPVASSNATPAMSAAAPPAAFTDFGMDDQNIETVPAAEFDARDAAATTQASAPPAQSFAATAAARSYPQTFDARSAAAAAADDALLELGDLDTAQAGASADDNEFVLDIGDGGSYAPPRAQRDAPVYSDAPVYTEDAPSAVEMQAAGSMSMAEPSAGWVAAEEFPVSPEAITEPVEAPAHVTEAMATTEATFSSSYDATRRDAEASAAEPKASEATSDASLLNDSAAMPEPQVSTASTQTGTTQLSPETIDAIARRVVEHLSDRVVREIAWEVVPDLAERLIRRKLEEEQARQ